MPDRPEIAAHLENDKTKAREIGIAARNRLIQGLVPHRVLGLHATTSDVELAKQEMRERQASLEEIASKPFYRNIAVIAEGSAPSTFYITRGARTADLGIADDAFQLVSWQTPLGLALDEAAQRIDEIVEMVFIEGRTRHELRDRYKIDGSVHYQQVLPKVIGATFTLRSGSDFVADADAYLEQRPLAEPPAELRAAESASKQDIIELRSADQTEALRFPIAKNVLIGGPPGSGKTTIGVMRICCLIAAQAEAIAERTVYRQEWTRVLVLSPQMVENLRQILADLLLPKVKLGTFQNFFREVGSNCGTLANAIPRDEEESAVTLLKGDPLALQAVFGGLKRHVEQYLQTHGDVLRREMAAQIVVATARELRGGRERIFSEILEVGEAMATFTSALDDRERLISALGRLFSDPPSSGSARWLDLQQEATELARSLWRELSDWGQAVSAATVDAQHRLPVSVNLSSRTFNWATAQEKRISDRPEESRRRAGALLAGAKTYIVRLRPHLIPSVTRLKSIPETEAYGKLLKRGPALGLTGEEVAKADLQWRRQLEHGGRYSEQDTVLAAWLGLHVASLPATRTGVERKSIIIGYQKQPLTHILVDEAQDLSPIHGITLGQMLDHDGTMSVAGDLSQRVTEGRGLENWEDLGIHLPVKGTFPVNERQSSELGHFVAHLHETLYGRSTDWRASNRPGPRPRICVAPDEDDLFFNRVAEEILEIRRLVHGATIGVLYDEADHIVDEEFLQRIQAHLEHGLAQIVLPVFLFVKKDQTQNINQVDCVKIISVVHAKGLEFDGVVLFGHGLRWGADIAMRGKICQNRLYVAVSRPTIALSVVTQIRATVFDRSINDGNAEFAEQ